LEQLVANLGWNAGAVVADPDFDRIAEVSGARQQLATAGAEPTTAAYSHGLVWVGAARALPPLSLAD